MRNRACYTAPSAPVVAGAVDCGRCLGTGMRQPDLGRVRNLADNECTLCDGFGWLDLRGRGEGGRERAEGAGKTKHSVGGNFLQGQGLKFQSPKEGPKPPKIFASKKAAPRKKTARAIYTPKTEQKAREAVPGARAKGKS